MAISNEINILHLEDEVMDVYLIRKILERSELNCTITVAGDKDSFISAIETQDFDIILADHSLPQFNAMEALAMLREMHVKIPFILVTGTVSEEFSVNAMKEGAWDYILKDRLKRLPVVILSAIDRFNAEEERRKSLDEAIAKAKLMKEVERLTGFGSWRMDFENDVCTWSDEHYRLLGYEPGEIVPSMERFMSHVHRDDFSHVANLHEHAITHLRNLKYECRLCSRTGDVIHIYSELQIMRDECGAIICINGYINDITQNKLIQKRLEDSERKYQYIFEKSPVPSLVYDAKSLQFLDVNKAAEDLYGYSFEEFMHMSATDIVPDYDEHRFRSLMQNVLGNHTTVKSSWVQVRKNGEAITNEAITGSVMYDGREAVLVLVTSAVGTLA